MIKFKGGGRGVEGLKMDVCVRGEEEGGRSDERQTERLSCSR